MIEIMKASAGSGKTFNLAKKYIELLLSSDDRFAYRHILAVTFTNKATDEMKSRILKELHVLATDPSRSDYTTDLMASGRFKTEEQLRKNAHIVLCNILHDYSSFAVSTIDRFFQQTLKAFSREIGQFASYQVELDKDSLVLESVDRILDSLTEKDRHMLEWLTDNTIEQIESGKGYHMESNLLDVARRLKSEQYRSKIEEYGIDEKRMYAPEALSDLKKICNQVIDGFAEKVYAQAETVRNLFIEAGVPLEETSRGFLTQLWNYEEPGKNHHDEIKVPTATFLANAVDPSKWFPKAKAKKYLDLVSPFADVPLADFAALFNEEYKVYRTAVILKGQIFGFGVAGNLYREFNQILKEKNVLSIDDSNTILKGIIDGTDTPFIYEKLGVRYEHFLLDEFQDTSHVQWDNFRPLLKESIDNGFYNLIVGDVKQSIYRWRNSDWQLLDSQIENTFLPSQVKINTLKDNWRSASNIVEFNNSFFKETAGLIDAQLAVETGSDPAVPETGTAPQDRKDPAVKTVAEIYSDVCQHVASRASDPGFVKFTVCEKSDRQSEAVVDAVRSAHASGCPYKEIAVLIRTGKEGADIASALIAAGISVVTDDSLKIASSAVVRRLVALLAGIDNPQDSIAAYLRAELKIGLPDSYHSLVDLSESLLRKIMACDAEMAEGEVLYIQSFMDLLRDFVAREGNNLHKFLEFWKEDKSSISSPSMSDSVRIMTVHKSKGLDFYHVIVPYLDKIDLFTSDPVWCHPDVSGTGLEGSADGIYDVRLSSSSRNTLFEKGYQEELKLQYIDNLNVMYVALTRAVHGMHLILPAPSSSFQKAMDAGKMPKMSDFSHIVWWYLRSHLHCAADSFTLGEENWNDLPDEKENRVMELKASYPSYPLNPELPSGTMEKSERPQETVIPGLEPEADEPEDIRISGRLKFSTSSIDFFAEDGSVGADASRRLRGILLHDILSMVKVPGDLEKAVEQHVKRGDLPVEEAEEVYAHLRSSIASVADKGWFPDDPERVLNEVSVIDTDGEISRPDRVVKLDDGTIFIIDYKFGKHYRSYDRQVAGYADLFRRMGYKQVRTALWYVDTGEIR